MKARPPDKTKRDKIGKSRSRSNIKFELGESIPKPIQDQIQNRLTDIDDSNPKRPRAYFDGDWIDLEKYWTEVTILFQDMTYFGGCIFPASFGWHEKLSGKAQLIVDDIPVLRYTDRSTQQNSLSTTERFLISPATFSDTLIGVDDGKYQNSSYAEVPEAAIGEGFVGSPSKLFTSSDEAEEFIDKEIMPFIEFSSKSKPIDEAYKAGMRYTWPVVILTSPTGEPSAEFVVDGFEGNSINLPNHIFDAVKQNIATFRSGIRLQVIARTELWGINVEMDMTNAEQYAALSLVPEDCQLTGALVEVDMYWDDNAPPFNNPSSVRKD